MTRYRAVVAVAVAMLAAISGGTEAAADSSHVLAPRTTTNGCSNPVLASNLSGWGTLDGGWVSRDTVGDLAGASWAFDTGGLEFYMPQLTVSAGQTWTFGAEDRVVNGSGTATILVDWYSSGGQYLYQQPGSAVSVAASTAAGGTWTLVSGVFTVPSGATTAHVLQSGDFGSATGTDFKATACDYEQTSTSTSAAVRYGWGTANAAESDEYNGTAVDLTKWGLFGTAHAGDTTGCSAGYLDHGQRCAQQTTESGGYLKVNGTASGVTGGLWSRAPAFTYGRIEVRERAVVLSSGGAHNYNAVPLLIPAVGADWDKGEIDFAERSAGSQTVSLNIHYNGGPVTSHSIALDTTQFHNYAIDWEPTSITWYVDGNVIWTANVSVPTPDHSNGGAQLDMLNSGTINAAEQDVDWVHMYPVAATAYTD